HPNHHHDQRQDGGPLARLQIDDMMPHLIGSLAVEHPLIEPQHITRRQNHTDGGEDGPVEVGLGGALQHQEFAHEVIQPPSIPRSSVSSNCAAILTSSDGCHACARKFLPWRPQPASPDSSLSAPSSTNWRGPASLPNSLICCAARISRAHRRVCPGRSPQCRISFYSRSCSAATTWAEMSSCCSATPACVSANASTCLMTACARPVLTNGLFMFPSASSKPNAWSPSM